MALASVDWPLAYCGIAKETAYAAPAAPAAYAPLVSVQAEELAAPRGAAPWGTGGAEPLRFGYAGHLQVEAEAQPDTLGHFLTALLGAPQTVNLGGGAYRHRWEPRPSAPSYSVEAGLGGASPAALRAIGALATALTLTVRAQDRLTVQVAFVAREVRPGASATASFSAEEAAPWNAVTLTVDSAADAHAEAVVLTAVRTVRPLPAWGSAGRAGYAVLGAPVGVQVNATLIAPSSAWYGRLRDGGETAFVVTATGGTVGIASYQVIIDCPRMRLDAVTMPITRRAVPRLSLRAVGFADARAARGAAMTVVNGTAGY